MSKKYSAGEKYDIIKRCINGEISQRHAAEMMDVHFSTIQDWIRIYEIEGIDGLTRKKNKSYSTEIRENMADTGTQLLSCPRNRKAPVPSLRRRSGGVDLLCIL